MPARALRPQPLLRRKRLAQIQRERKLVAGLSRLDPDFARRVAHLEEAVQAPAFGLVRIDRKRVVTEATRVRHMVLAAAQ